MATQVEKLDEVLERLQELDSSVEAICNRYSFRHELMWGLLRGAAALVGAVMLITVGGYLLRAVGVIPGMDQMAEFIFQAFERARLR